VSESVFEAASLVLVPMVPAPLPARTLDQMEQFFEADLGAPSRPAGSGHHNHKRPQLLAFFSMVDHRRKVHGQIIGELAGVRPEVLSTEIPAATVLEQMGIHRAPVEHFAPRSSAAAAYRALWAEVQSRT
jgi:cellulose biosynthesis protein BcsQ